ncbi:SPOR domain-containing protein [Massilia sp. CF038]|uniref:SPOR domain-containing protein n=1 Tax=Massilia sp. CF038 TaxID=1881045 RepID=UPI00091E6CD1|nr:SPOR domain-containing protein [Massilia sp. CF038]SHH29477.1 Sporulation related domain-containing protein [Massilia sp. CF038]
MLKFLFWALLCINGILFAYGQGYLGTYKPTEHEPERIRNQLATDQLKLLSAAAAARLTTPEPEPETPAPAPVPAADTAPKATLLACSFGNFDAAEARRFGTLVAPLKLGARQTQDNVTVQEVSKHMVMIPPLGSKEAADRKAAELKEQGVSNYFIMNENGPTKWAISLGVFKSEAAAQTLLAALKKQGVGSARVVARSSPASRVVYRFSEVDTDTRAKLDAAAAKFDDLDLHSCK